MYSQVAAYHLPECGAAMMVCFDVLSYNLRNQTSQRLSPAFFCDLAACSLALSGGASSQVAESVHTYHSMLHFIQL